jgi:regulator of sirC expression with transglutaminase-like and TPR domain
MDHLAYQAHIRHQFTEIVSGSEHRLDLARAALLIASEEYPGLDSLRYIAKLEVMAAAVRGAVTTTDDPTLKIRYLSAYLFGERGFRGNAEAYYDPRNSFLNDVVDRKLGIPITLSIIYMEVGRRVGMPLQGIGMPGHFIMKYAEPGEDLYIDPFNRERILTLQPFKELIQQLYG